MLIEETVLLHSYHVAETTGGRLGFLKQEFINTAESLVKQGKLDKIQQGLYRLPKNTKE